MTQKKRRPAVRTRSARRVGRTSGTGGASVGELVGPASERARAERGAVRRPTPSGAPASRSRRALERASTPLLMRLQRLPTWLVPLLMLALALIGLIVGGLIGFIALALIALFLGWLALVSWPVLNPRARLLRLLAIALVAAAAAIQLTV